MTGDIVVSAYVIYRAFVNGVNKLINQTFIYCILAPRVHPTYQ